MRNSWMKMAVFILFVSILLVGCTAGNQDAGEQTNTNDHNNAHTNSVYDKNASVRNMDDPLIIPAENGEKRQTTDEHGGITHGMGSSVYSLIGSSGLHDGGVSSHLESRLSGEGINGVKVFVLDDTIILARSKAETTANKYDPVQDQVLKGTEGMSGKGEPQGITKIEEYSDDNFEKAKEYMNKAFNGNVQILTVTNPAALDLIEKIKTNLKAEDVPYNEVSSDIIKLVKMTREK